MVAPVRLLHPSHSNPSRTLHSHSPAFTLARSLRSPHSRRSFTHLDRVVLLLIVTDVCIYIAEATSVNDILVTSLV